MTLSHAHGDSFAKRKVDLEFEEVPDATLYEIKVVRLKDKDIKTNPIYFKTKKPIWSAEINPGHYLLQLRSYDDRGVPGDWSEDIDYWVKVPPPELSSPPSQSVVSSSEVEKLKTQLKWLAVPGAGEYRIEVESTDGQFKNSFTAKDTSLEAELPVAKSYRWRVQSISQEGADGDEPESGWEFSLLGPPLESPKIETPITKIVTDLHWDPVPYAQNYDYSLGLNKNGKWIQLKKGSIENSTQLPFDLSQPSGRYRLSLQAKANFRQPSKWMRMEFPVTGGLREPAAIEAAALKESLQKPTRFYGIASYLVTSIDYVGKHYESNTSPHFSALGGTGRVGLGYQDPENPWGGFGIMDLSGFNIEGSDQKFSSVELHATYKLNFASRGQTLFGFGIFQKELPVIKVNPGSGFSGVGKVRGLGPHGGLQYWLPLSMKFGLQANARAYYTFSGSADGSGATQPSLSYQLGVLGSYRLNANWMGYAGYAYRKDEMLFKADPSASGSFAKPGDVNSIEMQGHYLNLILERSF